MLCELVLVIGIPVSLAFVGVASQPPRRHRHRGAGIRCGGLQPYAAAVGVDGISDLIGMAPGRRCWQSRSVLTAI